MIYQDRPYQQRDIPRIRDAFRRVKRVLYVACCGSGKTVVFSKIAQGASAKNKAVTVLAHRKELILQCSGKLTTFGVDHGIIKAGIEAAYEKPIQVASVQTAVNHLPEINPNTIIADEAHHSQNATQQKIIKAFPEALLLGVTASPIFDNGKTLAGYYDELVQGPSVRELVEDGYLVRTRVFAPPMVADLAGADYTDNKELEKRMNKRTITGNAIEHYTRLAAGWPAIAYCTTVKHADDVAEQFKDAGYKFFRIDGKTHGTVRDRLMEEFRNGEIQGLASCDLIGEGTDVPRARVGIKLAPGRSLGKHIQNDGRLNRPFYAAGYDLETRAGRLDAIAASEKPYAVVMDHVNNMFFNGLPDDDFIWSLTAAPIQTRAGGSTVPIQVCQQCDLAFPPAAACPFCGHDAVPQERVLKYTHGQLQEIKRSDAAARKIAEERLKKQKIQERRACKTYGQLVAFAEKYGYENPEAWAGHFQRMKQAYKKGKR